MTGGAQGIGAAVARRLASHGAAVTVADVNPAGEELAASIGGRFVVADVSDPSENDRAVEAASEGFGGLDLVHLNAGVTSGCGVGDDFDVALYRRAMGINLDGVVYGIHAALPSLRGRPGAQIVATASLAGLVGVPGEPIYAANKHAVVGLVRSLGPIFAEQGVRINALCPGFADTAIVDGIRELLAAMEIPIIPVEAVVEAFMAIVTTEGSGDCWYVQDGRPTAPFEFRNVPGPRATS